MMTRTMFVKNHGEEDFKSVVNNTLCEIKAGDEKLYETRLAYQIQGIYHGKNAKINIRLRPNETDPVDPIDLKEDTKGSSDIYATVDGKAYKTKAGFLKAMAAMAAKAEKNTNPENPDEASSDGIVDLLD